MILEGLVTTIGPDGSLNIAPMGPRVDPDQFDRFVLRPYTTSTTYKNLKATGEGVLHVTDDVLMIAQGAIGKVLDPPTRPADCVNGRVITSACRYIEFRVIALDDQQDRTTILVEAVYKGHLRDYFGLNRAKHAVVEAAILATRTAFLPGAQIRHDFERLAVLVEKTGGPVEREAFNLLHEHLENLDRRRTLRPGTQEPLQTLFVRTGSRLHFGPLAWGPDAGRQFGGIGLMIEEPHLLMKCERSQEWRSAGPLAERALQVAQRTVSILQNQERPVNVPPLSIQIEAAPPEHRGLGTGTQLTMAVASALWYHGGCRGPIPISLVRELGRGQRSGIGIEGFHRGGFLVDGGHGDATGPTLIAREQVPRQWHTLLIIPNTGVGLHGVAERQVFRDLSPICETTTDRLCRLVLLEMLPSLKESNLVRFGAALQEYQGVIGRWFAPAQGGLPFGSPEAATIAQYLQDLGLHGVGQSSWGPTLYGFDDGSEERRIRWVEMIRQRFQLPPDRAFWTAAANQGIARRDLNIGEPDSEDADASHPWRAWRLHSD